MLTSLSLETLPELDNGKAAAAFDRQLKRAADDCFDRPGDPKPRKISLNVSVSPVLDVNGVCEEVRVQIDTTCKVPAHKTKAYSFGITPSGQLKFNPDSLDSINQKTLMDEDA